jgi:hypothetical protein
MNLEARGYVPSSIPKKQETSMPAPIWFAAERPPSLGQQDLNAYRAWVAEVKAIYAKIGAENTADFKRIMQKRPNALSKEDLETLAFLLKRISFAWEHGCLMPEKKEVPEEDWEYPLDGDRFSLKKTVTGKDSACFVLTDEKDRSADGRKHTCVISTMEQKTPPVFREIKDLQIIGGLPCYVGERLDKDFSIIVGSREVSRLPRMAAEDIFYGESRLHAIIDVQGVPAWFERDDKGIFFSLNGTRVGDPKGYHEIQEFCAYEGKLLFQARKGKFWHTIFDGKEIHPPTKNRETYKHFGLCKGEVLFTQTSITDFFVTQHRATQVFCGERLVHEIKGIHWDETKVKQIEGHVITSAEYKQDKNYPPYPQGIWMDGHRIISKGNDKTTFIDHDCLSVVGNALAFIAWSRKQECLGFFIDGVNIDFSGYTIEDYVFVGGEIYLVGWKESRKVVFQGICGEKLWEGDVGDHRHMPKISTVFGKLFFRVFEHEHWRVYLGTRELPTDQEAIILGDPVTIGDSHIVYWSYGKDCLYRIVDEEGNLYGTFTSEPSIEPLDAHRLCAYGREGRGKDAKLVRRLIEL